MQYKFYDGDSEFWNEGDLNLTAEELKKRFGIEIPEEQQDGVDGAQGPCLTMPVDAEHAHCLGTPQYDIFDQELADQQYEAFLRAGRTIPDDDDQPIGE